MPSARLVSSVLAPSLLALLLSCTAGKTVTETQNRLRGLDDYRRVDLESVSPVLNDYRKGEEDEVLYRLERGMLSHYQEQWESSAKHFQQADQAIERHYSTDVSKNLQSLLVNDLQLAYQGEPYEGIYLTTFNCLNYLHQGDLQGALVEMRRITHKLELLNDRNRGLAKSLMERDSAEVLSKTDKELDDVDLLTGNETPPEIQQNSAFGRFLTTVLYSKTGQSDDAQIELQKLRTALADQGQLGFLSALARADEPGRSAPPLNPFPASTWAQDEWTASAILSTLFETQFAMTGRAKQAAATAGSASPVTVPAPSRLPQSSTFNTLLVSFSGRAPRKEEQSFSLPLVIDDETVQLHFAVPVLKTPESRVERVRAVTAGDTVNVPTIEDMKYVAQEMFEQEKPIIYTRAVLRSFLKAGTAEGAGEAANEELGDAAGFLVEQAGNAMSKQAAQADTRGWQTLPGRAHAVVAELPEGTHEVTFEFLSDDGRILERRTREVSVRDGQSLSLAESIYLN